MKFGEHLFAHSAPEWRKQYIQYEEIKILLYNACKKAPSQDEDSDEMAIYMEMADNQFFCFCEKELQKINSFYEDKLMEAADSLQKLQEELETLKILSEKRTLSFFSSSHSLALNLATQMKELLKRVSLQKEERKRSAQLIDLKLAFSEFYLSLVLLKNYQKLNYTGFRKILKKHDKLFETTSGAHWFKSTIESAPFHTNNQIDNLIGLTEAVVTDQLEGGNRAKAMKKLRVVPPEAQQNLWTTFKLGLFSGALIVLLLFLALTGIYMTSSIDWPILFKLYRAPLLLIIYTFLLGVNVYGWRSAGVNHILIFELDPRNHLSEQHLMELATFFGLFWVVSVLTFVYSTSLNELDITEQINPLTLLSIIFILFMVNPVKTCSRQARFWFISVMGRIVSAPFCEVKFADFWLADQLNSLVQVLLDIQYTICMYKTCQGDFSMAATNLGVCRIIGWQSITIRAILSCLPAWFRFMQCLRRYRDSDEAFPHLANAAKYSTTFFIHIFATLYLICPVEYNETIFVLWMTSLVISSIYGLVWDVKMDWGLFEKRAGDQRHFLRCEMVYPYSCLYYAATIQNLILRFSWLLSHFLVNWGYMRRDSMVSISAILEIYRRFIWNFFRLENEHLNNCGKFRVVRDISLAHLTHPRHVYRKRHSFVLTIDRT